MHPQTLTEREILAMIEEQLQLWRASHLRIQELYAEMDDLNHSSRMEAGEEDDSYLARFLRRTSVPVNPADQAEQIVRHNAHLQRQYRLSQIQTLIRGEQGEQVVYQQRWKTYVKMLA